MIFGLRPLFRQNLFSLTLPTTSEYFPSYQELRQFCVFENLGSGEYTLKLVYIPTRSQKLEKLKEKNADVIDPEQYIESSSIKLNLIRPQKEEPNTLTTPDIKFQVFIAGENEIKLSKIIKQMNLWEFLISRLPRSSSHPKPYLVLPLCFRIINESSKPYRFDFYNFSTPDFIYDGTLIDWEVVVSPFRIIYGKPEDYPIVMPNKSIDFYPDLVVFLSGWNQFRLSLFSRNEFHLISEPLKPQKYNICINYQNQSKNTHAYDTETQQTSLLENFWVGAISTPPKILILFLITFSKP
ncbi:MAG: hypothetical protein J7647_30045 [Cyanobacteria bacterium SBLK]|nr:hypothetical protein [Cyanobacteria bacterium SBLK]